MAVKVAINGFGRIGRLVFRAAMENKEAWSKLDLVAVNDLGAVKTLAHLLKHDSVHGPLQGTAEAGEGQMVVNGKTIKVLSEKEAAKLPWKDLGVDIVVESTGKYTEREKANQHIAAGAKKVIISAPAKGEDITIVMGVNEEKYDAAKHHVMSNASCTTNCLAPVAKAIMDNFGIKRGLMTTIHSYTNDQRILDFDHKDLRRARAAAVNMIPTTTGAAKAVALVIPELKGKLNGYAMRVPTPNVSVVDLNLDTDKNCTVEEVNAVLKAASNTARLKNIMAYTDEPLVSSDFNHTAVSGTVDGLSTMVIDGNMVKILAWYDNEWGYSNRVIDLALMVAAKL